MAAPHTKAPQGQVVNHIRRLRFEAGEMTQQALATAAGVTRQTISSIEGGKYSPSLELAFKIALVLEQPIERVFVYVAD